MIRLESGERTRQRVEQQNVRVQGSLGRRYREPAFLHISATLTTTCHFLPSLQKASAEQPVVEDDYTALPPGPDSPSPARPRTRTGSDPSLRAFSQAARSRSQSRRRGHGPVPPGSTLGTRAGGRRRRGRVARRGRRRRRSRAAARKGVCVVSLPRPPISLSHEESGR